MPLVAKKIDSAEVIPRLEALMTEIEAQKAMDDTL
jgi:hypothetical protein